MTQYIATFFSHFGAVRFQHLCTEKGLTAQVRPVPRSLSSSCGSCVYFAAEQPLTYSELCTPELEQLVQVTESGYVVLYSVEA